jgi:hypothetical protein
MRENDSVDKVFNFFKDLEKVCLIKKAVFKFGFDLVEM